VIAGIDDVYASNEPAAKMTSEVSQEDTAHYRSEGWLLKNGLLSEKVISNAQLFADNYTRIKASEWKNAGLLPTDICLGDISRTQIIDLWLAAGRPVYERQILHYSCTKEIYRMLTDETLSNAASALIAERRIYASATNNYRFKSSEQPWTKIDWHADRYYWEEVDDPDYDFIICWVTLENLVDRAGGVELIPMSTLSGFDVRGQRTV